MKVLKYIEENYNYIVIFTNLDNGDNVLKRKNMLLEIGGYTCCWKISTLRKFKKIILYIRENGINKLYKADYDYKENVEDERYRIHYHNLEFLENTPYNWKEFANTQNPIRYIEK
jgi:hypothetical protein